MKVVIGLGYVGFSTLLSIARRETVIGVDTDIQKLDLIKKGHCPVKDDLGSEILNNNLQKIQLTSTIDNLPPRVDCFVICLPTNFNETANHFDTAVIDETVTSLLRLYPAVKILIKSTVPVGYCRKLNQKHNTQNIYFAPEFLREGSGVRDTLYPTRIIVGGEQNGAEEIIKFLASVSETIDAPKIVTESHTAELIKLASNTYLANRISFFNEVETLCRHFNADSRDVIVGMSSDPRIGHGYNNPSFGYGGYCLPKDVKQLQADASEIYLPLLMAIDRSNFERMKFWATIVEDYIQKGKTVGFFGVAMKKGSDNLRESATLNVINLLKSTKNVILYDDKINLDDLVELTTCNDVSVFLERVDVIFANRRDTSIANSDVKLITPDIFEYL